MKRVAKPRPLSWPAVQACLLALAVGRAWRRLRLTVERTPNAVMASVQSTGVLPMPRLPARGQLALVCRRRQQRLFASAAGAGKPADLEIWPVDALAQQAAAKLRHGESMNAVAAMLTAICALYEHFSNLDRESREAAPRMHELRQRKGVR